MARQKKKLKSWSAANATEETLGKDHVGALGFGTPESSVEKKQKEGKNKGTWQGDGKSCGLIRD